MKMAHGCGLPVRLAFGIKRRLSMAIRPNTLRSTANANAFRCWKSYLFELVCTMPITMEVEFTLWASDHRTPNH